MSVWLLSDCQTAATTHHSREHAACVRSDLRADKEQMRLQLVVCWFGQQVVLLHQQWAAVSHLCIYMMVSRD